MCFLGQRSTVVCFHCVTLMTTKLFVNKVPKESTISQLSYLPFGRSHVDFLRTTVLPSNSRTNCKETEYCIEMP